MYHCSRKDYKYVVTKEKRMLHVVLSFKLANQTLQQQKLG